MLKLKDIQTKPVIYQGLEVDVPADTNFMWLRHNDKKTVLWASAKKPVWHREHKCYIPPSGATLVAVLEHADLTVEQVKDSLETDESLPTAQDLEQLDVVVNLVKNLRRFANSLERNVTKASTNPSPESIQSLLQHVYADEGELDNFYNHAIEEATKYGIVAEQDEDSDEDHEALLKFINAILK
jgi:hypothetical protein